MAVKPIAYSYWRRIQDEARDFSATPASVKDDVKALAREDVANGTITAERYEQLIGEPYETDSQE